METNNYVPEIYIGENGNWLINGVDTGQPSRGPQGKSAYEIAVNFGYQGTEAEWLSGLKGEQGSKGDKGAKGDTGAVGPQGPKGEIDAINDQTPTYTVASDLTDLSSGEKVSTAFGKIAKAVSSLINHIALKATDTVSGHVKLSKSPSIVEAGTYALDAVEKNMEVSGTLANQISEQNTNLIWKHFEGSVDISTYKEIELNAFCSNKKRLVSTRFSTTYLKALPSGTLITLGGYLTAQANSSAMVKFSKTGTVVTFLLVYMFNDDSNDTTTSYLNKYVR